MGCLMVVVVVVGVREVGGGGGRVDGLKQAYKNISTLIQINIKQSFTFSCSYCINIVLLSFINIKLLGSMGPNVPCNSIVVRLVCCSVQSHL